MNGEKDTKLDKDGVIGNNEMKVEDEIVFEDEEGMEGFAVKQKKLREELKECRREKEEYLAGWQRAKADLINERKEEEARRKSFVLFGTTGLLTDIIPILDSFDMAFGNKEAWEKVDENWRKGVIYIHSQLLSVLKQYGCEPFDSLGEYFDPSRHISVSSVLVHNEAQNHTVMEVLQKGYVLEEKVLRPARVVVGEYKA